MECRRWRDTLQVWYDDNLALASNVSRIKAWFAKLLWIRPSLWYHPNLEKGFLITSDENMVLAISHFHKEGFKIRTGFRYLGGFKGTVGDTIYYISKNTVNWFYSVKLFSLIYEKEPQAMFTGLNLSIQHKWAYTQRLIKQTDKKSPPLECALSTSFTPTLFGVDKVHG